MPDSLCNNNSDNGKVAYSSTIQSDNNTAINGQHARTNSFCQSEKLASLNNYKAILQRWLSNDVTDFSDVFNLLNSKPITKTGKFFPKAKAKFWSVKSRTGKFNSPKFWQRI